MKDVRRPINQNSNRFMDRLRLHMRARNLAYTTEKAYSHWILRFIRYHPQKLFWAGFFEFVYLFQLYTQQLFLKSCL